MKNCPIKKNVYFNTLQGNGVETIANIEGSILSDKDVYKVLGDTELIIGVPGATEIQADHNKTIQALKGIPEFADNGLLYPAEHSQVSQASQKFIGDLAVTPKEAAGFLNHLDAEGAYTPVLNTTISEDKGVLKTDYTATHLNNKANIFLGKRLNQKTKKYFTKGKNGTLNVSKQFMNDFNRYNYIGYLNQIGELATQSMAVPEAVEPVVEEEVKSLKSSPIVAHLNASIRSVNAKRKAVENDKGTFNKSYHTDLSNQLNALQNQKNHVKTLLTQEKVLQYLGDILSDVRNAIKTPGIIPKENIAMYMDSLNLVINAAERDVTNNILSMDDMNVSSFFDKVKELGADARDLMPDLNAAHEATVQNLVEVEAGRKYSEHEFYAIENMKGARKYLQNTLGIHQIDNPIIQYIGKKIEDAIVRANTKARIVNEDITKLYKKLLDTNFDTNVFYQRGTDGLPTGRMVDRFSAKYFKDKKFFRNKYNKDANLYKNEVNKRKSNSIDFNPTILFELEESDPQRQALEKELYDMLGSYTYSMYYKEARELYDTYKTTEEVYLANKMPTPSEYEQWKIDNSPVYRLQNITNGITHEGKDSDIIRGTDRFLVNVPRRYNKNGKDLGWYDPAFDKVQASQPAMDFYAKTRKAFIDNEMALHNYNSKFKPPTLGFVNKTNMELAKAGKYSELSKSMWDSFSNKYIKSPVTVRKMATDPITGEQKPVLTTELHSIPDEIRRRAKSIYINNPRYKALDINEGDDKKEMAALRALAYKQAAREVEADYSGNFLHSITLANYSTSLFIEKSNIETEVNLAGNLVRADKLKYPFSKADGFNTAKKITESALQHHLNVDFYAIPDEEVPEFLHPDKAKAQALADKGETLKDKEAEKGTTVENILKGMMGVARFTTLGFSPILASINVGQAGVSNLIKGIEGHYYTIPHLVSSYKDILLKKNRNLVDRLYIVGDVAYQYDKSNLHNVESDTRRLHPMYMQTSAEKINQGAVAIAILKGLTVRNTKTGKETSVYNALDDNAELSGDWYSDEFKVSGQEVLIQATTRKIRPANRQASGDYINPLLIERNQWGKLGLLFRKYLPEMILDRFGERRKSLAENREVIGRFRALGMALHKYSTGRKTEVDKLELQGAKAAAFEVALILAMQGLFLGLRVMLCDTMECKEKKGLTLVALNYLGRLSGDIISVANPLEFASTIGSPFTIESMVVNYLDAFNNLASYILPGGDSGEYKADTDYYEKGDPKFLRSFEKLLPIYKTNYIRTQQMSNKLQYNPILSTIYEK